MNVDLRPHRLTWLCRIVAGGVVVVFGVLALLLPKGSSEGQQFGVADQIAFFGIGLLLATAALSLTRARVRADEVAIHVRNILGERSFVWPVVVGIDLPEGAPWAQLELHDDETVALLALQANDGGRAVDGVLELRRLLRDSRRDSS